MAKSKPHKEQTPDITAKVYLVPYGYQIDIIQDGKKLLGSVCRDFGGSYKLSKLKTTVAAGMFDLMSKVEDHLIKQQKKRK